MTGYITPATSQAAREMHDDVYRRTFLRRIVHATIAPIGALLAERLPGRTPLDPTTDPIDQITTLINDLCTLDRRDGGFTIMTSITFLGRSLHRCLSGLPPKHDEYRRIAAITAEAVGLSAWVNYETGDPAASFDWYRQARAAAYAAGDHEYAAFSVENASRVMAESLGDLSRALGHLQQVPLSDLSEPMQAYVLAHRGWLLAEQGHEAAAHKAFDLAVGLAKPLKPDTPGWSLWASDQRSVELWHALTIGRLGYPDTAYELLDGLRGRMPAAMQRAVGLTELGLARAALSLDEPARAAEHAKAAHTIREHTRTPQLKDLAKLEAALLVGYSTVPEVRELADLMAASEQGGVRYQLTDSKRGQVLIHQTWCRYAKRGSAKPWPAGQQLTPDQVRLSPLRGAYELCERCML